MRQNLNSLLIVLVTLMTVKVFSQEQQVSSLLSNYGLGVKFSEATVAERAQGDLSVVSNNTQEVISIANPALLSNLQLTSFSLSFQSLNADVQTQNTEFGSSAISISNISFGVPLGQKGGFALGLRVDSAVGFEVQNDDFYNFGNGTVNHVYVGFGYEVYKGLSLGAQLNQYFGRTEKRRADRSVQQSVIRDFDYNTTATAAKLGVEYKTWLPKGILARVGAYGVFGYDVDATGTTSRFLGVETTENNFQVIAGQNIVEERVKGTEKNPFKSVIGAGLGKSNHWFAGVSYENQDALEYSGDIFNETLNASNASQGNLSANFEKKSKISFGGYIIPKKYALKNYLNRVHYRAGFKYEKTGLTLNNNSVKNLGISFGLGLPVGKRVSYANISVELGRLGEFSENKYEEKYFNIGVNFSLSDKWFNKRVID
ncbi:hypothetical protein ACXGQW_09715 [Wenyingzhuangia sp. IMCC45533]